MVIYYTTIASLIGDESRFKDVVDAEKGHIFRCFGHPLRCLWRIHDKKTGKKIVELRKWKLVGRNVPLGAWVSAKKSDVRCSEDYIIAGSAAITLCEISGHLHLRGHCPKARLLVIILITVAPLLIYIEIGRRKIKIKERNTIFLM